MIDLIKASTRGATHLGWLESRHTFSFGEYRNPQRMGFGAIRVINDDIVQPSQGFGTHSHHDMEIISYVVEGCLEHKDSLGNGSLIKPGDIQLMRAGSGISHSEFNHLHDQTTRFLQIWIKPDRKGLEPSYQQIHRPASDYPNRLRLLISPDGADGSLSIARNIQVFGLALDGQQQASLNSKHPSNFWIQVVSGDLELNGHHLTEGDGLALLDETTLDASSGHAAEALVFQEPII